MQYTIYFWAFAKGLYYLLEMLQKGIDEPLESHVKSNQTTFCKLAAG